MPRSSTTWERALILLIFAAGAWLRFQHLEAIEVNIDQIYPMWQAIQTLDHGDLPLTGQGTSVLFDNPPLTGYLFVPVLALVRQPIAAYTLTLVLNTFAIWLAYRGLRWLVGTRPALVGAALFAANPWIIEDSRRTWVQSLLPFFVCLVFWALAPVLIGQARRPGRRVIIALVALALVAHTYLLAYALIAPVGLLMVRFWARIPRRALLVGGSVFALLMALFAAGLLQTWDNTTARAENFTSGEAGLSTEALRHGIRLVTGWDYADARGQRAPADDADRRGDISDALHLVWLVIMIVGAGRALWMISHRRETTPQAADAGIVLLVWFLVPIVMMSYVSRVVHPFYLLLTVPAGHGLAGLGLAPLLRRPGRGTMLALAGLVALTGAINGLNAVRFAQNTAAYPSEDLPETLPLGEAQALGERIRAAREPDKTVFSAMAEWTPVVLAGQDFRVEQVPDGRFDRAMLIPPQGGVYMIFQLDPEDPLPPPLVGNPAGDPLVLGDGAQIELWRATADDLTIQHAQDVPSDIGVSFAGWAQRGAFEPGETVLLDTFWRVDELRPERGIWAFAPFAHVYDGTSTRVLIADGVVLSALTWRVGDVMVQRLALDLPADALGPFAVDVGLYDSVRATDSGQPGINAIFFLPDAHTPVIRLDLPSG